MKQFFKKLFCIHDYNQMDSWFLRQLGIVKYECSKCGKVTTIKVF